MPTPRRSQLAVTLKQNKPFVSLQQEAFLSILRTASELSHATDQFLKQFDITQPQYNVLRILRGAGAEGLCRNEISVRMVTATPDMSRLLDRIEAAGWVTRERDGDDRRQVMTFITAAGEVLLNTIEAPMRALNELLFEGATEKELKALTSQLARIRDRRAQLA